MKKVSLSMVAVAMTAILATGFMSCNEKKADTAATTAANTTNAATVKEAAKNEVAAATSNNNAAALISKEINGIYLNANDLDKGTIKDTFVDEVSGFTLNATEEKVMEVKDCDQRQIGSDLFTKAISTKGSGKYVAGETNYRTISFPAKAGDSIIVYAASSSKTDSRPLHVVNMESGEEIGTVEMMADNGKDVTVEEVVAKADGNYCVYATSGTGYIFQIKVGK